MQKVTDRAIIRKWHKYINVVNFNLAYVHKSQLYILQICILSSVYITRTITLVHVCVMQTTLDADYNRWERDSRGLIV